MEFDRPSAAPPVLGVDPGQPAMGDFAGLALLLGRSSGPEVGEVTLEIRGLDDGTTALLAYGSLSALVTGCGSEQPWIAVPAEAVDRLAIEAQVDVVLWDVDLPRELRHTDGGR
ncbi:SAV_915 family protein [Actinosynnema sp. NPDC023794]